jgi:hypothetical protein
MSCLEREKLKGSEVAAIIEAAGAERRKAIGAVKRHGGADL